MYGLKKEVFNDISRLYHEEKYLMDTHTAVAHTVLRKYKKESKDYKQSLIIATASPYKFTRSVMTAIDEGYANMEDFALVDELEKLSGVPVPNAIQEIRTAPVLHKTECDKEDMEKTVLSFLERKI